MKNDFLIIDLWRSPAHGGTDIHILHKPFPKSEWAALRPVVLECEIIKQGGIREPFLRIGGEWEPSFWQMLSDEIFHKFGISPEKMVENKSHLEGQMEAMKLHLDDMRKIAKVIK